MLIPVMLFKSKTGVLYKWFEMPGIPVYGGLCYEGNIEDNITIMDCRIRPSTSATVHYF